jgi:hypothetical protein
MWVDLLVITVAAAVMPLWAIMALFLLRGAGGLRKAIAFATGTAAMRLLQGLVFGVVFSGVGAEGDEGPGVLVSTLLLILGLFLLNTAYKKWRKEEDESDDPPKWIAKLNELSPLKTFGMGALLMLIAMKHWVFTLSAIATIEAAAPGLPAAALAYVLFVILAQIMLIVPILFYAVAPARAAPMFDTAQAWVQRNNRPISIVVSLIFGVWFLYKSLSGFLG